jgi:hypothetical protein
MSLIGTVANYGGKQPDNFQDTKQFISSQISQAIWIYKKIQPLGLVVETPADKTKPIYINNDLYVNGSIYNTSDANLKENVVILHENKINNILKLNPVEYSFKTDINNNIHYGFLAQEVEQIFPELVKNENIGYKTVNYIEMIPLLVSKIKDMQNDINLLLKKVEQK